MIGVIGMSVVLSLAAGSLLLVAANSRNGEDDTFRRAGCYLDAESGLMMGVGWLRAQGAGFITTAHAEWPANPKVLPQLTLDNGSLVTVSIRDNTLDDPANLTKTVTALAVNGTESQQFSWDIGVSDALTPPTLTLKNWRSP